MEPDVLFVCFSSKDRDLAKEFASHVRRAVRPEDRFEVFLDEHSIEPGEQWDTKIKGKLDRTIAACFLVSVDLFESEYVRSIELPRLVAGAKAGNAILTSLYARPIAAETVVVVRAEDGEPLEIRLSDYQGLNQPSQTLSDRFPSPGARERVISESATKFVQAARARRTQLEFARRAAPALPPAISPPDVYAAELRLNKPMRARIVAGLFVAISVVLSWVAYVNHSSNQKPQAYGSRLKEDSKSSTSKVAEVPEQIDTSNVVQPVLDMVEIPAGTFRLGSPIGEDGRFPDEGPVENVRVESFAISRTEITRRAWREVMGAPPKDANWSEDPNQDAELPANFVNWFDALEFCNALSRREGRQECYTLTGEKDAYTDVKWNREANGYRLPIEAEWEFAARGGTATAFPWTVDSGADARLELITHAWWSDNSEGVAHPVGMRLMNNFKLSDMIGNVNEWCWDEVVWLAMKVRIKDSPSPDGADPTNFSNGRLSTQFEIYGRAQRGGDFSKKFDGVHDLSMARSARRGFGLASMRKEITGFRCVTGALARPQAKH